VNWEVFEMTNEQRVAEFCRSDLELFQRRLDDLKAGRFKVGTSTDGVSWIDTTAEEITRAQSRIGELSRLLGG
jgi:hypothetical protein